MNRKELDAVKAKLAEKQQKASDMEVLISALLSLPPGQVKKLLTDEAVLSILRKYGFEEGGDG